MARPRNAAEIGDSFDQFEIRDIHELALLGILKIRLYIQNHSFNLYLNRRYPDEMRVDDDMREIWGIGTPRSLRPIWVCEELGLKYRHHTIGPRTGETQEPEFTALNRKQKIPFYRDSEVSLSESLAICRYLAHQSDGAILYVPDTKQSVAKEDEWCAYIYGELDERGCT